MIAQKLRSLPVDRINDVRIKEISRDVTCEELRDLFDVFAALDEFRQKFVRMKFENAKNVSENFKFHPAKGSRKLVLVHDCEIIFDSALQRSNVILLVFLQLADDVEELCGDAKKMRKKFQN